ncbi:MAG: SurA N-terminal domain-containing protein [Pontixanthobacter sp.]
MLALRRTVTFFKPDPSPVMITFFRSFFQSKFGIGITLAFLALIAFAFASSDVANTGTFGGVSGGDRVAVVGGEKISTSELNSAVNTAVNNVRQENPTISIPAFIEQGGFEQVLDQLIERVSLAVFAERFGLRAGTNLVNSEIIAIPAFRGADGNFSEETYRQIIAQQNMNDDMVRNDLRAGLFVRQLLIPGSFGATMPDKITARYASLFKERREGAIGILPSSAFAPDADPSAEQLSAFYRRNRGDYIRPERRRIRYFTFGDDALGTLAAPTNREIAARYRTDRAQYQASETRTITQLIVPTQQAAQSIRQSVQSGGSLEKSAQEAGLQTVTLPAVSRSELAAQSSGAVAQAVFAANEGSIATPARSGLGFHVARIDGVERIPGRSLQQASADIAATLTEERRRAARSDLAERIEGQVESGASLREIADELRIRPKLTKPVTGAGQIYGEEGRVDDALAPALQSAFQMEEENPQLAEIDPGKTFLIYEVTQITPAAAAPLGEIRDRVIAAWKRSQGSQIAKKASARVMARVAKGASLAAALDAEKVALADPESVDLTREQLGQAENVPAPLALLFSMAQGTTKRLAAPQDAGWFVVRLNEIEAGTMAKDDPLFAQAKAQLSQAAAREYSDQLRRAVENEVGVERNRTAIDAVRKQLTGNN